LGLLRGLAGFGLLTDDGVDLVVFGWSRLGGGLGRTRGRGFAVFHPTGAGFCVGGMAGAIHRLARAQLELTGDQGELAMGIAPFTQTQVVEEILPAPATQRIGAQLLALLLETAP